MKRRLYEPAVCSWSLRPENAADLVQSLEACGIRRTQLALNPFLEDWDIDETRRRFNDAKIEVVSGMMTTVGEDYSTLESIRRTGGIRPDDTWPANLDIAKRLAEAIHALHITLVSFHAGFLPHDRNDPERARMIERLHILCEVFAGAGATVALETGQESADTLVEVLDDVRDMNDENGVPTRIAANIDPANMILYDTGDPCDALRRLIGRVDQCHIKDARRTTTPGEWGEEVPVGEGDVDWPTFLHAYLFADPAGRLVIEREAGEDRIADVKRAAEHLKRTAREIRL